MCIQYSNNNNIDANIFEKTGQREREIHSDMACNVCQVIYAVHVDGQKNINKVIFLHSQQRCWVIPLVSTNRLSHNCSRLH